MKVTYTRAYLQRLCEQALVNIGKYQESVFDRYQQDYDNRVIIHKCLPFYDRWFENKPVDIRSPFWFKGLSVSQRCSLSKLHDQYVSEYEVWNDVENECLDILSAIEGSQQVVFELDYQLAANIKEANKL